MTTAPPLVIVLGAGASNEVDLPLGWELKKQIAESLNFKVDDFRRITGGNQKIQECLHRLAQAGGAVSIKDLFEAATTIRDAMPLAPSIDNFIDSHRSSPQIAAVGKLAIAACILKAEKSSKIFIDRTNVYDRLNFSSLEDTWFNRLFALLFQHCSWEAIDARLSRLAIVSFNYDRCVKHYLRNALSTYYRVSQDEADRAISKLALYHPYGSVGPMRFEAGGRGLDFGEQPVSNALEESARQLKTFTESTDDTSSEIAAIRAIVRSARAIVFLGFAFHPLNLKLLYGGAKPVPGFDAGDLFATAKGISESDASVIASELGVFGGYTGARIRLRRDLTAAALVNEYSRHLSQVVHAAA